jgi:two-component system LytT family sensor kinase
MNKSFNPNWNSNNHFLSDFTRVNILFWGIIALINYFQDVLLLTIEENENPWSFAAIFSFDWPLWAAFTPFIIKLGRRYPLTWRNMYVSTSRQFGLATLFVIGHTVFEFLIIEFLVHGIFPQYGEEVYIPGYFMASIHSRYIVYFLIIGAIQRFELYSRYQTAEVKAAQLREQLSAAQLESLRMQLQPHFLFNTHHTIASLILKNENNRAVQMISRLSDLLRKSLEKTKTDLIPLYQELEMVSAYMDIQQVRFQERLKFFLVIDPSVKDAQVPSFFLQPLIENSVIHGIEPSSEKGEIKLSIDKTVENRLSICLEDNGIGLTEIRSEGIGLTNTKSRLEHLYKGRYSFKMGPGKNNKGTRINIEVPIS